MEGVDILGGRVRVPRSGDGVAGVLKREWHPCCKIFRTTPRMAAMQLKTYRAPSMAEALAQVKKDLGSEAVILHTRSYKAGGIAGVGARSVVEITASDQAPRSRPARSSTSRPESARRPVEVLTGQSGGTSVSDRVSRQGSSEQDRNQSRLSTPVGGADGFSPAEYSSVRTSRTNAAMSVPQQAATPPEGGAGRSLTAMSASTASVATAASKVVPVVQNEVATAATIGSPHAELRRSIEDELASIKRLIGQVLATSSGHSLAEGPLASLRTHLIRQGLDHALVGDVVHEAGLVDPGTSASASDRLGAMQQAAIRFLAARLRTSGGFPIAERQLDGRPLVIALVGPTGVGKTTTIAKLAANYRLKQGKRVGLMTADTYRIAAVEQLRVYADIIRLPLKVAMTPQELGEGCRALAETSDVILIDTAGRSPTDAVRLAELEGFLREARPHQTHLVLSAVLGEQSLARSLGRFEALHPTHILLSKLDESASLAPIFNLIGGRRVPVGCVTTGQEVPDHIAPADARALAATLVAGEGIA